jgi:hypothetical protein
MAVVAAALFYTLFASPSLGREPQLRALIALKLPEPIEFKEPLRKAEAGWLYFSDMENFGLFSPGTGVVESCYRLSPHAACDGTHLVNVFPERGSMDIYTLAEARKVEAPFNGYPFLEASRIFLIRPDQQGVSEIDGNGGTIWSREFGSILTCASATAGRSVWGTLGGEIVVQNSQGEFATIEPSSFGISLEKACVYSVAISSDGETIAARTISRKKSSLRTRRRGPNRPPHRRTEPMWSCGPPQACWSTACAIGLPVLCSPNVSAGRRRSE